MNDNDLPLRRPEYRRCSKCGMETTSVDYYLHCAQCCAEDSHVPDAAHWKQITDEAEIENAAMFS